MNVFSCGLHGLLNFLINGWHLQVELKASKWKSIQTELSGDETLKLLNRCVLEVLFPNVNFLPEEKDMDLD